jgi:hypothetical protein
VALHFVRENSIPDSTRTADAPTPSRVNSLLPGFAFAGEHRISHSLRICRGTGFSREGGNSDDADVLVSMDPSRLRPVPRQISYQPRPELIQKLTDSDVDTDST